MASEAITRVAHELEKTIALMLGELADVICGRPAFGSPEWTRERERQPAVRAAVLRDWHLVKVMISVKAGVDPKGNVINARLFGASWQQVGDALGTTRQSAHERYAKMCEQVHASRDLVDAELLEAADWARSVVDAQEKKTTSAVPDKKTQSAVPPRRSARA